MYSYINTTIIRRQFRRNILNTDNTSMLGTTSLKTVSISRYLHSKFNCNLPSQHQQGSKTPYKRNMR